VDRDGHLDLAVANSGAGTVSILYGAGDGTFPRKDTFIPSGVLESVALADLDGSGRLQLVVADHETDTVCIMPDRDTRIRIPAGQDPSCLGIADLNLDRWPDLVVANTGSNTVSVLPGDGTGGFGVPIRWYTGCEPVSLALGRLDADSRPDIVVANAASSNVTVLLSPGGPVAVLVEELAASCSNGNVALTWRLSDGGWGELAGVLVERAETPRGPYLSLSMPLTPERSMRFTDVNIQSGQTYWYRLVLLGTDGNRMLGRVVRVETSPAMREATLDVAAAANAGGVPIRYGIPRAGTAVRLAIFDVSGRLVRSLRNTIQDAGNYTVLWDGSGTTGLTSASGIYLVQLRAGPANLSRKIALLRH
jgi:VCBS repeat protein/flagellar hook capping protein FlgD